MNDYNIDCTGNACIGDEVQFEKAIFSGGSFGKWGKPAKFVGTEIIEGKIIKDSYGKDKQQHTFTLETISGKMLVKGRNLYRNGCMRKPWDDENERIKFLEEKYQRGEKAKEQRKIRKENVEINDIEYSF